jgi:uncharacterized iron-regulated protein
VRSPPWLVAFVLLGCASTPEPWHSPVARDHPLAGTLWDVAREEPVSRGALVRELGRARFVLLGEKHDNADHHRLQAELVAALGKRGALAAVAFEMLRVDVAGDLARSGLHLGGVRAAWQTGGWPDWEAYAPIVEASLGAGRPVAAADLSIVNRKRLRRHGADGLAPDARETLGFSLPFPESRRESLAERIRESHCGHAPPKMLPRMIDLQRARDAQLARGAIAAGRAAPDKAVVLVTGGEHARRDRGAPVYLATWAPDARIATLLFAEVEVDRTDARADLAGRYGKSVPFDYVWFTPRVDELDPCEKFARELQQLRHGD